ncbi:putative transcription factor PosF21 [Drosera capensis]
MEKDKNNTVGLPPTGRFSGFPPSGNLFNLKPDTPPQSNSGGGGVVFGGHGLMVGSETGRFSHDLSRMPETPVRNAGHRRAHSEILTLPDDISFDSDLGVLGGADGPSFSDETEEDLLSMYLDMDKVNGGGSSATSTFQVGEPSSGAVVAGGGQLGVNGKENERGRVRHQHSQSMDGTMSIKPELLVAGGEESSGADVKKAMSAAKLAELALVDPKRAKRIWANRQSAARSKERKMRYIAELERKVQSLQTEATSLSAQLSVLQRDTNTLTVENSELKLRLQTTEQQVHLQDALNDALKEEIQHLKMLTGQAMQNGGHVMNFRQPFGGNQPFHPNNQAAQTLLTAQHFQQLQIHSQKQQQFQQQQQQQLQQLQHQQMMQQQAQLEPLQPQPQLPTGDFRMRGSLPSPSYKENASEFKDPTSKG